MRVLLLNAGQFEGMEDVQFPVEVEASKAEYNQVRVQVSELLRVGASSNEFTDFDEYYFDIGTSVEVLDESTAA